METVILKSFSASVDGVVDYRLSGDALKIRYSIRRKSPVGIAKLFLLSSLRPGGVAIAADTLEFADKTAVGEKKIDSSTLAFWGYRASDIDTFVVAEKESRGYSVLAAGFARLFWDIGSAIDTAGERSEDFSLKNAGELLRSLKDYSRPALQSEIIKKLNHLCSCLKESSISPCEGFGWYELPSAEPPVAVSAYEHLLTEKAKKIIEKNSLPLLFGIGRDGMSALAAKKSGENPFENAADCTVLLNGFYIVGVLFGEDGQYFAKPE